MATPPKSRDLTNTAALSAVELFPGGVPSEAHRLGRRVKLFFEGGNRPELDRIEFHPKGQQAGGFLQRGYTKDKALSFRWTEMPQALSLFFLEYLVAGVEQKPFVFRRTPQTNTMADAVVKTTGKLYKLFVEALPGGGVADRVGFIFDGVNLHGTDDRERSVFIKTGYLPHDCVEVFWEHHPITAREDIKKLAGLFRKAWKMPPPSQPPFGVGEASPPPSELPAADPPQPAQQPSPTNQPKQQELLPGIPGTQPPKAKPPVEPVPAASAAPPEAFKLSKFLADEFGKALDALRDRPRPGPQENAPKTAAKSSPPSESGERRPASGGSTRKMDEGEKQPEAATPEQPETELEPLPAKIAPELFQIQNPRNLAWDDSDELLNFSGLETDVWCIRDATEGVAIFGAVGSGKTSGSGSTIAHAFLQAGFGCLVLTAKPDEARRWLRLCQETGRAGDCIHVTPGSGHKLNLLQYESQRPGNRIAVTEDLVSLFRCLIGVMSRRKQERKEDDFWTNSTDQLMRMLFDIFQLSREGLTMNRLIRFIHLAPHRPTAEWRKIKFFADVMTRAEENAKKGSPQDQRVFREAMEYWTQAFPAIAEMTRSGIVTNFTAMANNLTGRGIHEMIGTDTNLTPEMILSGKIVILDVPLKGNEKGGLMVQAAFKLLFQQAIERRADKGLKTARPVALWEDEGHLFFSNHDVDFQPTARDCRAAHVILTQNLHNFFQQGHNESAVLAVFGAINTFIFHTNGEMTTNKWASEKIGEIKHLKLTTDGLLKTLRDKDISFFERRPHEVENVGRMQIAEETKSAMPPEDFSKLKRGGDGTCEAVILWLAHQFAANHNRNFCVLTFEQEKQTI